MRQPRNEFRKHKKSGHPAYIYEKVDDEFVFIGITHSEITNDTKNIRLEQNPDPNDKRTAYAKPVSESDKQNRFGKRKKDWKIGNKDRQKVDEIISANKKRSAPSKSRK